MKQAKAPIARKIQQIEEQLKPIESQIKTKVSNADWVCVFCSSTVMMTVELQQLDFEAAHDATMLMSSFNLYFFEFEDNGHQRRLSEMQTETRWTGPKTGRGKVSLFFLVQRGNELLPLNQNRIE